MWHISRLDFADPRGPTAPVTPVAGPYRTRLDAWVAVERLRWWDRSHGDQRTPPVYTVVTAPPTPIRARPLTPRGETAR